MTIQKTFEIDSRLFNDFLQFCEANNVANPDAEFIKMFSVGFNVSKYGTSPFKVKQEEKPPAKKPPKPSTPVVEPQPTIVEQSEEKVEVKKPRTKVKITKK